MLFGPKQNDSEMEGMFSNGESEFFFAILEAMATDSKLAHSRASTSVTARGQG